MKNSIRQRAVALVLLLAGVALLSTTGEVVPGVDARSLMDMVPGSEIVRDLTNNLVNRLGRALDNQIMGPFNRQLDQCLGGVCPKEDPDAGRNVSEIIRSRGFLAEEYNVTTRDGYILTIQRIVNPLVDPSRRKTLKPVILQHGLLSSSVDWVINSQHVRPQKWPRDGATTATTSKTAATTLASSPKVEDERDAIESGKADDINTIEGHRRASAAERGAAEDERVVGADSQEHPNALGFYLANEGYDVFLANSRGNLYGQRHVEMSSWNPKFWSFTFDEQIKYDLPDITSFVQTLTGHTKVGYVGHSQGTAMMFGLLADQPDYADVFEPVIMLAPVAYVSNSISPVKYFAVYTPLAEHINMWFGSSNVAVRYLAPLVCKPEMIKNEICANIVFLSTGFDADQFDMNRVSAYMAHMPSGTSVKNIAHYGQEIFSGRFSHFDHGILGNQAEYGQSRAPDYDLTKIRSKSLVLFTAENDWLASPKDVAKLKADLRVPLFRAHNISEFNPKWNHIDFVYGKDCGELVNARIIEAFHHFD